MSVQKVVNNKLALGVPGSFYDTTPRRVHPYSVQPNPVAAVAATGEVTLAANPTANDTVTIANKTYKFVSALSAANDVKIGTAAADTIANLVAAVNGATGAGSTYGTGTTANVYVTAAAGSGKVTLTAKTAGASGNALALSASFTSGSNGVVAFANGADAGAAVVIGRAFTVSSSDNKVVIPGGTGVFAGILVDPKAYPHFGTAGSPLAPTLQLPAGVIGGICSFGHILVTVKAAVYVGYKAQYNNTTGEISGVAANASADSGCTLIPHSEFIFQDAGAGETAILKLGD